MSYVRSSIFINYLNNNLSNLPLPLKIPSITWIKSVWVQNQKKNIEEKKAQFLQNSYIIHIIIRPYAIQLNWIQSNTTNQNTLQFNISQTKQNTSTTRYIEININKITIKFIK